MSELKHTPDFEPSVLEDINKHIPEWNDELHKLLPTLPSEIDVVIKESTAEDYEAYEKGGWNYGVNGSTQTLDSLILEIDTESDIPHQKLLNSAKATFYHESYHLARGYSFESTGLSLVDVAIEEGLATKFEIDKAGSNPRYGHHQDRETMLVTLGEVKKADLEDVKDWQHWKFYDPKTDRHWILYRVGTFIAEEALANNPELEIQDLAKLTQQEIMRLARL